MVLRKLPVKLQDCQVHGSDSGAELFLVEGDSASQAVASIRNEQFQAVLPMQGKPLNAHKSSLQKIRQFELFRKLLDALGYASEQEGQMRCDSKACRFDKIIFLFDPDADGIHCEALMLIYFYRMLFPLLEQGRVHSVRAPMFQFSLVQPGLPAGSREEQPRYAYSDEQAKQLFPQLESLGFQVRRIRYRGLAGIHREALLETCVAPQKRRLETLWPRDAEAAMKVFGISSK